MRWTRLTIAFWIAAALNHTVMNVTGAEDLGGSPSSSISFHRQIEPLFRKHCYGCHQAAKSGGDYQMTDFASLVRGGESGDAAIVPGDPHDSYLIDQIRPVDGFAEMPREPFEPLTQSEFELIETWIRQGAHDDSPASRPAYDDQNPPTYSTPPTIPSLDVSPDGRWLALAGHHEVLLRDAYTGTLRTRLVGGSPRIESVRFSPDGQSIAALGGMPGEDGEVQIWDLETETLRLSVHFTGDVLSGASWSPDASKLSFGGNDNVVRAIDTETGLQVLFQGAHEDWIRDTGFTFDGQHLVSVARDMSSKLTEVKTQRFVDNVTSITPGALSGGLNSVAIHPSRHEMVVGGADGIAKVYRIFRQTQRRIGDDANLIRVLPKMPGRLFSVSIGPDGRHIAAASTLDGTSEVRVWAYDFDGELSEDLKRIMGKRLSDRSAEDTKELTAYRNQDTSELMRHAVDAPVYSIRLGTDGTLFAATSDNRVVRYSSDGSQKTFEAVPIAGGRPGDQIRFDARSFASVEADAPEAPAPSAEDNPLYQHLQSIQVEPSSITLRSPYDYVQLLVTGVRKDGSTVDLTHQVQTVAPESLVVSSTGIVRAVRDGDFVLRVSYADFDQSIDVRVQGINEPEPINFTRDVNPVLSRLGCNQGTCHGAQAGKNGFKLSLRGYDPVYDIRALTDDLIARRIDPAHPSASLMLRKPLGLTPHQGGVLMRPGDPYHVILNRWIHEGAKWQPGTPRVKELRVFPRDPVVEQIGHRQQVRVVAHFADGVRRDVTREAFVQSGNTEVAVIEDGVVLTAVRRGEAPILARYEGAYAATTLTVMGKRPGYQRQEVETYGRIDELVAQKWQRMKIVPSPLADDATFLRRVYLDLTGLPPDSKTVREFLADPTPTRQKRDAVIDRLIGNDEFVEYWSNKWADLLQVNRKFLGVEGSKKFRDWIRQAITDNQPYDRFVHQILTATGSNREQPAASYFKVLRTPEDTMENTTHLFLGIRFNCNKCHDHPFERWTQDQYYEMAAFFSRVDLKRDPASGDRKIGGTAVEGSKPLYEIVSDGSSGEVMHGRTGDIVEPDFPYRLRPSRRSTRQPAATTRSTDAEARPRTLGSGDAKILVSARESHREKDQTAGIHADGNSAKPTRRERLADWITDPANPYFARSYVNRVWGYLMGTGLIEPIDDIRAGNPPTNPQLLDYLTDQFVGSGFDSRHLMRIICRSRTYQLAVETNPLNADDQLNYSHASARRLPAEVIYDAVHTVTGATSSIPGVPAGTRAAALADSGIKLEDGFLQNLGRPARESACECERSSGLELGPVMAMISGPTIGSAISSSANELESLVDQYRDNAALVEEIFLRALGRFPRSEEVAAFEQIVDQISSDNETMKRRLETAEQEWRTRHVELEQQRKRQLAETDEQLAARRTEYEPIKQRLSKERTARIEAAKAKVASVKKELVAKVKPWLTEQAANNRTSWHPLMPTKAIAGNKSTLIPQPDRSIVAEGSTDKGTYVVTYQSDLAEITGFRLEAIADAQMPGGGPGRAGNGNFVITEIEVESVISAESDNTNDEGSQPTRVDIQSAVADFTQSGFKIEQTFNGAKRNQQGWAVSGATGQTHWATFRFAKPIVAEASSIELTFKIHQFHKAKEHRLGRFRISVTGDEMIPLGLSEALDAVVATQPSQRSESQIQAARDHLAATDAATINARAALREAEKPVPPDAMLTRLQERRERLAEPTPVDPSLVRLRQDRRQSQQQSRSPRLTAAEDLVWAIFNSPAFLFNH